MHNEKINHRHCKASCSSMDHRRSSGSPLAWAEARSEYCCQGLRIEKYFECLWCIYIRWPSSDTLNSGVAFHHAGLDGSDRHAIEKGYLEGGIYVICCTSTLAVGVNLPCHLVIIKNTVCYQDTGLKEYADLEMMQMLGRAGRWFFSPHSSCTDWQVWRPQFDDSAIAVIITKQEKVQKYEKLVSGEELLESWWVIFCILPTEMRTYFWQPSSQLDWSSRIWMKNPNMEIIFNNFIRWQRLVLVPFTMSLQPNAG